MNSTPVSKYFTSKHRLHKAFGDLENKIKNQRFYLKALDRFYEMFDKHSRILEETKIEDPDYEQVIKLFNNLAQVHGFREIKKGAPNRENEDGI